MTRITDYAYIETTNYCNLACTFCNREEVIGKLAHMPIFKFRQVLEKLGPNIKEAKLMGMGEPFLHPNFDAICKIFKEKYPTSFLISSTNAQYSAKDKVEKALEYLDMLYVSIDGFEDSYEKYRPPAKWHKLIRFLDDLSSLDRHGCKIAFNYTVNPGNVYDIEKVNRLLIDYGFDELRLNLVQSWDENASIEDTAGAFSEEQLEYLRTNWKHLIKGKKGWDYSDCFWVQRGAYITVEGNAKVCCMNTGAKTIRNIFDAKSADDIFEDRKFIEIKKGCEGNSPSKHCSTCSYKELNSLLEKVI